MAINFPNSPNVNDTHSSGGKTWVWDGTSWKLNSSPATGIGYTDLSVSQVAASGTGTLTYNNGGLFQYTPPDLSGFLTSIPIGLLFPGTCKAQMCKITKPKIKKGNK